MSHVNYDFLSESILFGKDLDNNFASIDENVLKRAIRDYREYVLSHKDEIILETLEDRKKVSVTIESIGHYPEEELLKQLALYIDSVFIADPVFELTPERREMDDVMSQYMGMKGKNVLDKDKLAEALKYMKKNTSLVVCNFVKFVPITLLHEVPEYVPIRFDKDNFNNCLPSEVLSFLRKHIVVHNLEPCSDGLRVLSEEPLKKGTGLYIYFPECKERSGEVVRYMKMNPTTICDESGKMVAEFKIPNSISDMEFRIWLHQSINAASKQLYDETYKELCYAQELHSMYMTRSQFKADLLAKGITNNSVQSKIANLVLELDIPVFQDISLNKIMEIRQNYGESFKNFRSELGNKLIHLNGIEDDRQLMAELDAVSYEINETYINSINREISSLKRCLGMEIAILTGTLLSSYATGGMTLIGAAAATIAGIKDSNKLFGDIRQNPGFFLWKIEKKKSRKWGF